MGKITGKEIEEYINKNDIEPFPSQQSLCIPIINRIFQKMVNGLCFDDIKISGDLVIDGHHRYFSSLLASVAIGKVATHRTSATVRYDWKAVNFVDVEWDTDAKIRKLNEDDAAFNGIPLARIIEMTK